jgi:hypothetical protein
MGLETALLLMVVALGEVLEKARPVQLRQPPLAPQRKDLLEEL